MEEKSSYCQRIAAQCGQRAAESADENERNFLNRMRDNWLQVANGLERTRRATAHADRPKLGAATN
ncbi:MAG: hypothetical protein ACJ8F3_21605 [Xanthobacteraceae bacterium]